MTSRNWMTMAFTAAVFAFAAGCNNNDGKTRGSDQSRMRATDAGVVDPSGSSGRLGNSTGAGSPTGETTSGSSSGENAAKAPATGTTQGGAGSTGANGTSTDSSSGSTNSTSPGK